MKTIKSHHPGTPIYNLLDYLSSVSYICNLSLTYSFRCTHILYLSIPLYFCGLCFARVGVSSLFPTRGHGHVLFSLLGRPTSPYQVYLSPPGQLSLQSLSRSFVCFGAGVPVYPHSGHGCLETDSSLF